MNWKQAIRNNLKTIAFVYGAGLIMALVACLSIGAIIRSQVRARVEVALNGTEKTIDSYLREPKIVFGNIYLTVLEMLEGGALQEEIHKYLSRVTVTMRDQEQVVLGFGGVYGFIRDEFVDSVGLNPKPDYIPQQRPWYQLAIRSDTDGYTAPYIDARTDMPVISLVRQLKGANGRYYGVLSLDVDLLWLMDYAESLQLVDGGYGMIANQYYYVITHPEERFKNHPMQDLGPGYAGIVEELRRDGRVAARRLVDSDGTPVIAYFRELNNGWHIGVILPERTYYADLYRTALFMILLGLLLSSALAFLLLRLSAAKMRSDEENRSKSSFLAMMSHEIRTPLNAIIGLAEVQMRRPLPQDAKTDIETIHDSGTNLLGIINDILDFSKIDAGAFSLTLEEYDVPSLINDTVQLNMVRTEALPVAFELDLDPTIPARLRGDELRVKQVLNNLLSNAFKYTKKGTITLRAGWRKAGDDALLRFTVVDTGIGIREADLQKLFHEYSRVDLWRNRRLEGTGLGLAISKRLAQQMGGDIAVESEYGKGSSFTATMRQGIADPAPMGMEVAENLKRFRFTEERRTRNQGMDRVHLPGARVLVVDDMPTNLDVASRLLSLYGMTVDCVQGGAEAVERIRDGAVRYDAVFMDHMMPGMDGMEATRIIRSDIGTEYARRIPVIALTANALAGNEDLFLSKGFSAFVSKPINLAALDAVVREWIAPKDAAAPDAAEASGPVGKEDGALSGLGSVGGIDAGIVGRNYEGNVEIYLVVLRSYAKHTPALLETLRGLKREGLAEYAVAVHGLKGSSLGVGAEEVGRMAEGLERVAKAGDYEAAAAGNGELLSMTEGLLGRIGVFLRGLDGEAVVEKPVREGIGGGSLAAMLKACEEFDVPAMERIMGELEGGEYVSGADGELVGRLRELLDSLEYDDLRETLEKAIGAE